MGRNTQKKIIVIIIIIITSLNYTTWLYTNKK